MVDERLSTAAISAGPAAVPGRSIRTAVIAVGLVVAGYTALHAVGLLGPTEAGRLAAAAALPPVTTVFVVTMLVVVAQLLTVRVRTGRGEVRLAWGEAAAVVACYLLPVGLVPAAFLTGAFAARLLEIGAGRRVTVYHVLGNSAGLSLAAAGAAGVVAAGGVQPRQPLDFDAVAILAGAAGAYWLVSLFVIGWLVSSRNPQPYWPLIRVMAWSKVPMVVGNVVISIGALALMAVNPWWLLALPPALWLVQQTYRYRLRADDERRSWQVFAEATRQLNHLDEGHAAAAGLQGARRLFNATAAEIVIDGPPGEPRSYQLGLSGVVTRTGPPAPGPASVAVRVLLVGGVRVGELRLFRATALGRRDVLMVAAFGDALAASLHDAATNTELRTLTERSSYDAVHDGLTGLVNRASLLVRGAQVLGGLEPAAPVALLLLDVNHFKEVNTTLGHAAGDELLRIIAARLADGSGAGELLARLGGDEFALLMSGGTNARLPDAVARARHLAASLAVPTEVAGVQLSVEASVGVVASTAGEVTMTELLRRADIAMYQAKRDGSNVAWYEPARDDGSTDRLALLAELREALAGPDQVHLLMQPVVALDTGQPVSVEAFVRWRHPRRGVLKPVHFVRAAEQSELLGPFTRYVLDRALAFAGDLGAAGLNLPISVNLSPRSLHDRQLPEDVAHLLERYGVPAERLILEITETVVLREDKVVDDVLTELRRLGVQLAVDDFGTGCNALTFLTRVPVDEVKVDRTFVSRMVESPEAAAIVRTTVELGRDLGLRVVAEGVENAAQRKALVALGCPAAQGFYFYAPMPAGRMAQVLREVASASPGTVRRLRRAEEECG